MKPNISEFSYGYALTDELIHRREININSAPIFPSLYEEGQNGGGYDLFLDRPGLPLFYNLNYPIIYIKQIQKKYKMVHLLILTIECILQKKTIPINMKCYTI